MTAVATLHAAGAGLWERIPQHPFVAAAADGTLPEEAFDRWIVEDHHFVVGFRRFLGGLLATAPDEAARDVLAGGIAALTPELELFRAEAARRGLDLAAEPGPTTLGYTAYIQAAPADGAVVGWAVLYGAEKAYHDAWSAVRATAEESSPYWGFIDNWSSAGFGEYVLAIGDTLDRLAGPGPIDPRAVRAFERVVRFELRFWDAVHAGERW
jgi:thiaminase